MPPDGNTKRQAKQVASESKGPVEVSDDTATRSKRPRKTSRSAGKTSASKRRRCARGAGALLELAERLVEGQEVVIITGAGLSVASGIRPFRSTNGSSATSVPTKRGVVPTAGLWNDVIWTTATREAFRKDPKRWYNDFWLPHFQDGTTYYPNAGHLALQALHDRYENLRQITQNIDGLQEPNNHLIEAHGRVGLYKCIPHEDEESDAMEGDSDDDEDRAVQLGHRRQGRKVREASTNPEICPYQYLQSLSPCQLEPANVRNALCESKGQNLPEAPACPACGGDVLPQALLFDEGYHAHDFYDFERAEAWLESAEAIVFCGTSFAVRITHVALEHARVHKVPVYNFNLHDVLESTARLNVTNIIGPSDETLPKLVEACDEAESQQVGVGESSC
jgi:NAD-dependent deacetylase